MPAPPGQREAHGVHATQHSKQHTVDEPTRAGSAAASEAAAQPPLPCGALAALQEALRPSMHMHAPLSGPCAPAQRATATSPAERPGLLDTHAPAAGPARPSQPTGRSAPHAHESTAAAAKVVVDGGRRTVLSHEGLWKLLDAHLHGSLVKLRSKCGMPSCAWGAPRAILSGSPR